MVRHGNQLPTAGCISMREAILLDQAMNGGPSGPGSGFQVPPTQQQQPPPFAQQGPPQTFNQFQQPPGSIPGVNFLGGQGAPERRGFEERFQSFQNPSSLAPQGAGWAQPGPAWQQQNNFNGPMPGQMNPGGPGQFIDPLTGAPAGPVGNTGFGVDGGRNSRPSHVGGAGVVNSVTNQRNGFSSGVGLPGEALSPSLGSSNTEVLGQGESRVSTIMEDTYGYYYILYRNPSGGGLRVNITKNGLCTRYETIPENLPCVTACTADDECPNNFKCCPTGCSLGCMPPNEDCSATQQQQQQQQQQQVNTMSRGPAMTSISAVEAMCIPCQSHLHCNSQDQFCTMSGYCNQQMVCRQVQR